MQPPKPGDNIRALAAMPALIDGLFHKAETLISAALSKLDR